MERVNTRQMHRIEKFASIFFFFFPRPEVGFTAARENLIRELTQFQKNVRKKICLYIYI